MNLKGLIRSSSAPVISRSIELVEGNYELLTKEERISREQAEFKALFLADLDSEIKPFIENFGHSKKSNLQSKANQLQAKSQLELEK